MRHIEESKVHLTEDFSTHIVRIIPATVARLEFFRWAAGVYTALHGDVSKVCSGPFWQNFSSTLEKVPSGRVLNNTRQYRETQFAFLKKKKSRTTDRFRVVCVIPRSSDKWEKILTITSAQWVCELYRNTFIAQHHPSIKQPSVKTFQKVKLA